MKSELIRLATLDPIGTARRVDVLELQRDELLSAGKALVERWDTPNWKDAQHTGEFIAALRKVIAEIEAAK